LGLLRSVNDFEAEIVRCCFDRRGSIEAYLARNGHPEFRLGLKDGRPAAVPPGAVDDRRCIGQPGGHDPGLRSASRPPIQGVAWILAARHFAARHKHRRAIPVVSNRRYGPGVESAQRRLNVDASRTPAVLTSIPEARRGRASSFRKAPDEEAA
jgi:hypothetical protein